MRKLLISLFAFFAGISNAVAQSGPNWPYGYVPTPAQWQAQWISKQDVLASPPLLTTGGQMLGELVTAAPTTSSAGFNLAPGVTPTSLFNGDLWSTSASLFVRINGTTYDLLNGACSICAVTNATNTFTAAQIINLNAVALPAGPPGTIVNIGNVDGTASRYHANSFGAATGRFSISQYGGTNASPTAVAISNDLGGVSFFPYDGTGIFLSASIRVYAQENFTATHHGTYMCLGTVPNASVNIADSLCQRGDGGVTIGNVGSQGAGTLNLVGLLYNNNTAPTGSGGGYVLATGPTITGANSTGIVSLGIRDTSAAFDVTLAATSSTTLTAGRTLTLDVGNVAHTLKFGTTANTITFPNLSSFTLITSGDTATVTNALLATMVTNTIKGNATSGTASPTDLAIGSCSTASSALKWTTNTGFGCNTSITANAVAVGGITGLGTGVATALAVNIGTAGSFTTNGGALGTPSSGTATNLTGLPIGTGLSGAGTGVLTALANAVNATGGIISPTPTRAGDIAYWNGSSWTSLAGNNSGTQALFENASGVPSWSTVSGSGTVTSVAGGYGINGGPITTSGTLLVSLSTFTNSLGADVALSNVTLYFDGPSVAQGATGVWWASGTVSVTDAGGPNIVYCKLWDGTNLISSAQVSLVAANQANAVSLSGYSVASPPGNIRISCRDPGNSAANSKIVFNATGNSKDSTISVVRIQ